MKSSEIALDAALQGRAAPAGACWPGFAPAGEALFFASPKKSAQKKSEPAVCVPTLRSGQPAVLASGRGALELASLKQSRALISLKLCSSAQTEGPRTAQSTRLVALRATLPGLLVFVATCSQTFFNTRPSKLARAKQSAERLLAVEAGLSSAAVCGKRAGDCLSEASSSQTPQAASSARHRVAARTSARLFFGYFHLAKQKKVARPPGRNPASGSSRPTPLQQATKAD